MDNKKEEIIDINEKGRSKDGDPISLDRRLFMQFLAFGDCDNIESIINELKKVNIDAALYADINDFQGIGLLVMSEDPELFVGVLRDFLGKSLFSRLTGKPEYTMLGRTYSLGYEDDLERTLILGPRAKIFNEDLNWVIWYPLQRTKEFENLSADKQRAILGEHGKIGFKFGRAGLATDIRLACHGLDKEDNDFVIGILGKNLHPLSAVVQNMRKTEQTSKYLDKLGPFFIGKKIWQSHK
ncbi:MAG: hypothetical protein GTO02_03445 [Candidatus Dadabacteria bacterium]|nr:hypothetical protein [Candidatus Dadabacteria bacterium]NIQ13483.1 hypothetical protein [Candidatus Dadabacteria bacterium]